MIAEFVERNCLGGGTWQVRLRYDDYGGVSPSPLGNRDQGLKAGRKFQRNDDHYLTLSTIG